MTTTLAPRTLNDDGREASLLANAIELLRRVLVEVPPAALSLDTHMRIATLVTRVPAQVPEVEPSDAPTVTERPKLQALRMTQRQFLVLERALRSPHLKETFADLHDFLLVAARGYPFAPAPTFEHVTVSAQLAPSRTVAFRRSELQELQPKLVDAGGVPVDAYVVGCAFSWLKTLRARWPADADLTAFNDSPPVEVVHFPEKP